LLGKKNQSAVLAKYFSLYKKNPRSKVFAPLAESFRKLGMLDDAYKILKEGIRNHPNYTLGYIVLAHCYYDQGKFELTYNTLRPIVSQNADNISLQKVFAKSCMNLGHLEEALDTYKYLLFMNPSDKFFTEQVKKLEDDLMVGHKKLSLEQLIKSPEMERIPPPAAVDDDWVQVDFNQNQTPTDEEEIKKVEAAKSDDEWVMQKNGISDHPILKEESISVRSLDDNFYADEFEEYGDIEDTNDESEESGSPIVSHTLIDLYCAQAYFDKAIELLEKIIELNPSDKNSRDKLQQVFEMKAKATSFAKEPTEEDGHEELISIIESQVKAKSPKELLLQDTFNHFLSAIKDRADNYR
jgi:tetratricopeptide (TPR) repeat protein